MTDLAATPGRAWPRIPLGGIAAFLLAVLFLAGAVHICAILLVPYFAEQDGWSRLSAFAGRDQFTELLLDGPNAATVSGMDPLFITGSCRVELAEDPVGIVVNARERFWSLALYDPSGTIIFSLNDRTAIEGRLDMLVVNSAQAREIRRTTPAELERSVVVESQGNELIALLRLFAPTEKAREEARRTLGAAECVPTTLTLEPEQPAAAPAPAGPPAGPPGISPAPGPS